MPEETNEEINLDLLITDLSTQECKIAVLVRAVQKGLTTEYKHVKQAIDAYLQPRNLVSQSDCDAALSLAGNNPELQKHVYEHQEIMQSPLN